MRDGSDEAGQSPGPMTDETEEGVGWRRAKTIGFTCDIGSDARDYRYLTGARGRGENEGVKSGRSGGRTLRGWLVIAILPSRRLA